MNGDGTLPYDEAGATDNRLSLNPGQFDFTKDWEDGSTYTITAKVRQISPGEFEVVEAEAQGSPPPGEKEEPGMEEQASGEQQESAGESPGNYPNPAVAKAMQKG